MQRHAEKLVETLSVYVPAGEFDYEGSIRVRLGDTDLDARVLPADGGWDYWRVGRKVRVSLFLSKQGAVGKCAPGAPTSFRQMGRWLYRVEGTLIAPSSGRGAHLDGFPYIEVDDEILKLAQGPSISVMAELWAT